MGFLSDEELNQLRPAETAAFPAPIPTQSVSSDEFMPTPQTQKQREFEARIKAYGSELARDQGLSRRDFFKTAAGMAAAFVAMNDTHGALYDVSRAEAAIPEIAAERAKALSKQFVMDMHTHFLRDDTRIMNFVRQREAVGKAGWNPALAGKPQTQDDLKFANYFKEVFLDSDTQVACISGSPSEEPRDWFLTNQMKFDARAKVNKEAGSKRMFSHAIMTPGWPGWLDKIDEEMEKLKPDSWKGYTIGDNTNKNLSKYPYRLDDEKIMYPFYERLVKWSKDTPSIVNICIHKGLFPPSVERQFPHLVGYCHVGDVGQAAKDWPQLNFIIYHSAYRWAGGGTAEQAWAQLNRTGRIEWVSELAEIPAQYGVKNVYGDLGQIFAQSTMADPRVCAFMMGTLIKGLGADNVLWGSDAVWTGSPQWQIEALRRLEVPEDMQKKYGFKPLGENNARLYHFTPQQRSALDDDRFAQLKKDYMLNGTERSNLAYGYIRKPRA